MNEFDIIQQFMDTNKAWTDVTFPGQSAHATAKHLLSEADELVSALNDEEISTSYEKREFTKKEFADVYLLLLNTAAKYGLTFRELHVTALKKMEVNKKRKWKKNIAGFHEHVK